MENESSVAKPRGVLAKDIQSMNYMLLGHFSDSNTSGTFNKLNVSQVILSPPSVDLPLDSSWLHNPVTAVTWPLLSRDSYFQGLDSIFSCSLLGCGSAGYPLSLDPPSPSRNGGRGCGCGQRSPQYHRHHRHQQQGGVREG